MQDTIPQCFLASFGKCQEGAANLIDADYENEESKMCTNFEDFWNRAVPFLEKKIDDAGGELEMRNWTVAGKPEREIIQITKASASGIICLADDRKEENASLEDLKYTYDIWEDYINGMPRYQIRDQIRTSTYTICTIHYLLVHRICPCDAAI